MKQLSESQRARRREQKRRSYAKARILAGQPYMPKASYKDAAALLKVSSEEEIRYRAEQKAREQTPEFQHSMEILANAAALLGKKEES